MKYIIYFILIAFFVSCCSSREYSAEYEENVAIAYDSIFDEIDVVVERKETNSRVGSYDGEEYPEEAIDESYIEYEDEIEYESVIILSETEIEEEYFSLDPLENLGEITYVLEDTMIVGMTNVVNLTISHNVRLIEIISEVETFTEDNIVSESIRIAPVMRAKLIDPVGGNFTITTITEEEQFIESDEYTLWQWDVTPLKKGTHKVHLSVDVIIDDRSKSIEVYDDMIYVYSDDTFLEKLGIFFSTYWKWLISTLLIPLSIFLYKKAFNKKSE